jgi:SAM-dependent methyltransferase
MGSIRDRLREWRNRRWYGPPYFEGLAGGARSSAEAVVPLIIELLHPRSVVDVGCGSGEWVRVLEEHDIEDVLGIDGPYVERRPQRFMAHDLATPLRLDRTFDVATSLEVGEHLPADAAETLVDSLCGLAPAIVYGAAIPHQGGTGHLNERWQSWWAELFRGRGYRPVDAIRPRIWMDRRVDWWYAQNTLLYLREGLGQELGPEASMLDVVHPHNYSSKLP